MPRRSIAEEIRRRISGARGDARDVVADVRRRIAQAGEAAQAASDGRPAPGRKKALYVRVRNGETVTEEGPAVEEEAAPSPPRSPRARESPAAEAARLEAELAELAEARRVQELRKRVGATRREVAPTSAQKIAALVAEARRRAAEKGRAGVSRQEEIERAAVAAVKRRVAVASAEDRIARLRAAAAKRAQGPGGARTFPFSPAPSEPAGEVGGLFGKGPDWVFSSAPTVGQESGGLWGAGPSWLSAPAPSSGQEVGGLWGSGPSWLGFNPSPPGQSARPGGPPPPAIARPMAPSAGGSLSMAAGGLRPLSFGTGPRRPRRRVGKAQAATRAALTLDNLFQMPL